MLACAVTKCYYTFREGFCHFYEVKVTVFNNIRLVLPGYRSIPKASRIHPQIPIFVHKAISVVNKNVAGERGG